MVTQGDIAAQKRQTEEAKRKADELASQRKALLRQHIADLDKKIAPLQAERSKYLSDLSGL